MVSVNSEGNLSELISSELTGADNRGESSGKEDDRGRFGSVYHTHRDAGTHPTLASAGSAEARTPTAAANAHLRATFMWTSPPGT